MFVYVTFNVKCYILSQIFYKKNWMYILNVGYFSTLETHSNGSLKPKKYVCMYVKGHFSFQKTWIIAN